MSDYKKTSRAFIGKTVKVTVDRPLGSKHPKHNFLYTVNYGYVKDVKAPDGDDLDAYILNVTQPKQDYEGLCIAVIHRTNDQDDKLVVIPKNTNITDSEIETQVEFQEKWFKHIIYRD